MVNVVHRPPERRDLRLDVLRFAPVEHGGRKEQRHAFFAREGQVAVIAVVDQVELGENGQPCFEQLGDDGRVGQRRGADQRGVRPGGGEGGGDGIVSGRDQAEREGFFPPGGGAVHPGDGEGGVQPARQPRTPFAHGTETDDEEVHF